MGCTAFAASDLEVVELPGASAHVLELTECFVESVGEARSACFGEIQQQPGSYFPS